MKKLQNLSEIQKLGALGVSLASIGYASIVALFASQFDLLATMTLCALLVTFGAITCGVIVGMVKDETLARVVRGARYTTNAITAERDELSELLENSRADYRDERYNTKRLSAQVAERDAEIALLREELSDSEWRENNATKNLASARETITGLNVHYRASVARIANLQIERNRAVNTVDEISARVEELEQEVDYLTDSRKEWRETAHSRGLNAEKLRAQVDELAERVEVLQMSRDDWRTAYDKVRNGATSYTMSASTAFALGTLDRAYEVDGETRYPVVK